MIGAPDIQDPMTTGHVFIATSLDGFIARRDHQVDWLMKHDACGDDHGYAEFVEHVDGIVMGRKTYEQILTFGEWPHHKPIVVLSKSLTPDSVPTEIEDKVTITDLEPSELMAALQKQGWSRAYVDGGEVIQSFINDGLIEDIVLTVLPTLIGDGIPLFGNLDEDIDLQLVSAKSFPCGTVQSNYRFRSEKQNQSTPTSTH